MRIKAIVAYDGTAYYGFQHQPHKVCIEDVLVQAINQIDDGIKKVVGSGRTDKGVHAKGQVIHFDTKKNLSSYNWVSGINRFLPDDIRILKIEEVDDAFHARFDVMEKEYHYFIAFKDYDLFNRNYMEYIPKLDLSLMEKAIPLFVGTHDFKGFCSGEINKEKSTVKTINKAVMQKEENYIRIIFRGNGFLKYQVRKMVGMLVDIGLKKKTIDDITKVFNEKNPQLSTKVVSGKGLYLMNVWYKGDVYSET